MAPATQAGAEWVHVRPLRRPPSPGATATPPFRIHQHRSRLFLAPDDRPPLAGIKLVRPRPAPDGRLPLRALQLDPDRATAQTGSDEEKPQHQAPSPHPGV